MHTLENRKAGLFHLRNRPGGQRFGENRVNIEGAEREKLFATIAEPLMSGQITVEEAQRDRIEYLNSIRGSIDQVAKYLQRFLTRRNRARGASR